MPSISVHTFQKGSFQKTTTLAKNKVVVSPGVGTSRICDIERKSVNTPDYYSRADRGTLPVNDFAFDKYEFNGARGVVTTKSTIPNYSQVDVYDGCLEGVCFTTMTHSNHDRISSSEKAQIDAQAISKLLLSAKNQKVNISQFFHERQQFIDMVANTATRIYDLGRNLKKGRFVEAAAAVGITVGKRSRRRFNRGFKVDQSKAIASGWLELQYGWLPLLSDIHGAAEAIANARHGVPSIRVSSFVSRSVKHADEQGPGTPGSQSLASITNWDCKYDVKYVALFRVDNDVLQNASSLGLTNPASIVWELTPWSFVIDWFFPIGNWISCLDATIGLSFLTGSRTTFSKDTMVKSFYGQAIRAYSIQHGFGSGNARWVTVRRSRLRAWPMLRPPVVKNPLSLLHALNALALLTQLFRK